MLKESSVCPINNTVSQISLITLLLYDNHPFPSILVPKGQACYQMKNSTYLVVAQTTNITTTNQHVPFSKLSHKMNQLNTTMSHTTGSSFFLKLSSLQFISMPFRLTTRFHKTQKLLLHYILGPLTTSPSGRRWSDVQNYEGCSVLDILNSVQDPCFTAGIATAAYHIISSVFSCLQKVLYACVLNLQLDYFPIYSILIAGLLVGYVYYMIDRKSTIDKNITCHMICLSGPIEVPMSGNPILHLFLVHIQCYLQVCV